MSVVTVCLNGDHIYKQCVSERMCASANLNTERQLFPQAKEQIKKQQNWASIKWREKKCRFLFILCASVCVCVTGFHHLKKVVQEKNTHPKQVSKFI